MIRFELKTVLTIAGVRKAPITVLINGNEIDIDHRIALVEQCCKNRQKFDEVCNQYKAVTKQLIDEMRRQLHGAPKETPLTKITNGDVELEYQVYQSLHEGSGDWA